MDTTAICALDRAPHFGAEDAVARSWRRSADRFRIDPASRQAPTILTSGELRAPREKMEHLRWIARPEIDRLYAIVAPSHYVVLLADEHGIVVEHRGNEADAAYFGKWGAWLGGLWAEEFEGTNGIGTCLAERRPITIHRAHHFRERHQSLSCSGAPLFDPDDRLMGVLDISCCDPALSEGAHALTHALVVSTAEAIEERMFRERHRGAWIVGLRDESSLAILLAVDADQRIVGANRAARTILRRAGHDLEAHPSLWTLYARNEPAFADKRRGDRWAALIEQREGKARSAIVSPPVARAGARPRPEHENLAWRPRLGELGNAQQPPVLAPVRGGLPPAAMRRVSAYVDAHLGESIDLAALAAAAGLSQYHFARAFKQSSGQTPHDFVLARRLAKVQELLLRSHMPIADIACMVGFADQSHLTRRFRDAIGMTPRQFRNSRVQSPTAASGTSNTSSLPCAESSKIILPQQESPSAVPPPSINQWRRQSGGDHLERVRGDELHRRGEQGTDAA